MVDRDIALSALRRLAMGLPAFEKVAPNRLERARRRDALKWLYSRGYVVSTETGERAAAKAFAREIRLPRVTDDGRKMLSTRI